MGAWTVGHNLAGYLPESDLKVYDDWAEAFTGFLEEMKDYAESDEDLAVILDSKASMLIQLDEWNTRWAADGPEGENIPVGAIFEDSRGRLISFWLQWSEDVEATEQDVEEN
jgi:hypothetical protein